MKARRPTRSGAAARRGRPRSPAADAAILRAAVELFIQDGLEGVGIEQVAARAGVARTTVYRRWSSREALVAEAIARFRGAEDEQVLRKPAPPQAAVRGVIDALARMAGSSRYQRMVARLIGSTPDQPRLMETYLQTYFLPRRKVAAETLERARLDGVVRADADTELLLDLVSGAILYRLFLCPGAHTPEDMRLYVRKVVAQLHLEATT